MEENKTSKEQQTANNTDQVCDSKEKRPHRSKRRSVSCLKRPFT